MGKGLCLLEEWFNESEGLMRQCLKLGDERYALRASETGGAEIPSVTNMRHTRATDSWRQGTLVFFYTLFLCLKVRPLYITSGSFSMCHLGKPCGAAQELKHGLTLGLKMIARVSVPKLFIFINFFNFL